MEIEAEYLSFGFFVRTECSDLVTLPAWPLRTACHPR